MFRPARLFNSKNRRTPLQITPLGSPRQSVEERLRLLQYQWADCLALPTCLTVVALYEWWRWLFSIPPNPLLLSLVAAVGLTQARRKRRLYKAELSYLQLNQEAGCTTKLVIELLRAKARQLAHKLADHISTHTLPLQAQRVWQSCTRICDAGLGVPLLRHLLSALLSGLKRHAPWPNR
jgi:hypothetical protein